jgi:hypothetical protein
LGAATNFGFENGWNYGPYAGVEVGNYARDKQDRKMEDSVWAIDENGKRLDPEEQIWDVAAVICEECVPAPAEKVQETTSQAVIMDEGSGVSRLTKAMEPANVASQADDFERRSA